MSTDYITIELSKTGKYKGQYVAIVDYADKELAAFNWSVRIQTENDCKYANRVVQNNYVQKTIMMHREVMERVLGRELKKGEYVDHINHDGLDNRRENLRLATYAENNRNARIRKDNKSGYKGVHWNKQRQKWQAQIFVKSKNKHLGFFDMPEKAHAAYCEAADKYHGEFANHGSTDNDDQT